MIRKTRKILPVLALTLALIAGMSGSALAESYEYDGVCTFNGKEMVEDFSSKTVADAVRNLQPGDDVTFTVQYVNGSNESTDWYMENNIVKTLESLSESAKRPDGIEAPEKGGYTYELVQNDKNGKKNVLFSNTEIGGDKGTVKDLKNPERELKGLEPSTNALDDWFYIDTLTKKGQSGSVTLHVAFDGETEVNDYMDTDGELNVRFAVELTPKGTTTTKAVKTGDQSNLLMWAAIGLVARLLMLILAFLSRKRDKATAGKGGKA